MNKPTISIIAALSENLVIGKDNRLPWYIPKDLQRFKELTMNHPVIMGRKTYESIGKPLPGRIIIVMTHDQRFQAEGALIAYSLEEAIQLAQAKDTKEIFIIGGAEIFKQAMHIADRLYLTLIKGNFEGDAFFPDFSNFSTIISKEERETNGLKYTFLTLGPKQSLGSVNSPT